MRHLYLHGFASGPQSRKAQAFRQAFAEHDIDLEIPPLDGGDFEHLTISGQLRLLQDILQGDPVQLLGSSMGGYLAALYASRHPETVRLVLLAPAFALAQRWREMKTPAEIASWRGSGWLEAFHYGDKCARKVHYGLLEDSALHDFYPDFAQPALIFHGVHDQTVPVELSRTFAAQRANVTLVERDSDHELLNVLPDVIPAAVRFLTA